MFFFGLSEVGKNDKENTNCCKGYFERHSTGHAKNKYRLSKKNFTQKNPTLSLAHYSILCILSEHPCTQRELIVTQAVSPPSMSNTIRILEKNGWIQRNRERQDRRCVWLELTAAGQKVMEVTDEIITNAIASLSADECNQVQAGLEVLYKHFSQVGGK